MAQNIGGVILDTAILDRITAEMKPKAGKVVQKYGIAIAGAASQNAPVDTGALKNSVVSESEMVAPLTFHVQDGVEYGIFQELGTSRMAAHPFVVPALEAWAQRFVDGFAELFR